jgi:uncharacterized membrane protein
MDHVSRETMKKTVEEEKETSRVEAFSDGVFAIAITLLVLNIQVPHDLPAGTSLVTALARQWPMYLAFVTSFATIGIMWINHHRLFKHIRRSDNALLVLNGLLLMGVTVVPFPTALVAEYAGHPDARTAALVYGGTFVVIAIIFNILWRYASTGHRLLHPHANQREVEAITRQYRFGPLFYLLGFVVAFVSAPASLATYILLALFFALPGDRATGQV